MYRSMACLLPVLFLCAPCFGQDRGEYWHTNEELSGMCEERMVLGNKLPLPPPAQFVSFHSIKPSPYSYFPAGAARALIEHYEVVVDGEFFDLPKTSEKIPESLNPREELVGFRVREVYKGSLPDSIKVELNTDMLLVPGEGRSRYAKRQQLLHALSTEEARFRDRLDALQDSFDEGRMSQQLFESERDRLEALRMEKFRPYWEVSYETVFLIHGETFYDRGGYIKEDEGYLVGIDSIPGSTGMYRLAKPSSPSILYVDHSIYVSAALPPLGPTDIYRLSRPSLFPNIYWGETREDVVTALKSPEHFELARYFGAYDANDDEHCETLRSLIGPPIEATPKSMAMQLLDDHQLVAYGKFSSIPGITLEELRGLKSRDVRVRFNIQRLHKGEAVVSFEVELNSDMLNVPGEDESRYAKRQSIRDQNRLFALAAPRSDDFVPLSDREVSSWLGDTFYERGGVIHPNTSYVIGVNKTSDTGDGYLLGELPESPSRIYWGEEGDEILEELQSLTR